MRIQLLIAALLFFTVSSFAQRKGKFVAEVNYGLNGSFFVRSYDEITGPADKTYFYKKNFLGTAGGVELKYKTGARSSLSLGYERTSNQGKKNYSDDVSGAYLGINDFHITHKVDYYQLVYERMFKKNNPDFTYHLGILYAQFHQQEVLIENNDTILFDERNYKNSRLEEGGFVAGLHFSKMIDTKFRLGLKARVYYLASADIWESATLTPTLSYQF